MAIHTVWHVESPLNEEYEITDAFQPELGPTFPLSSLQHRMYIILIVATVLVLIFGLVIVPFLLRSIGSSIASNSGDVGENRVIEQVQPILPPASAAGSENVSPIFSPEVQHWAPQIEKWAALYDLDPNMVATVMQIESCGDPKALSHAGAQGLFQVMPFHFAAGEDAFNPDINAMRGMNYLADRLVQTSGNVGKAFAGYNGGHVAAGSNYDSWANETQRYYRWSTTIYADASSTLTESPALQEWMQAGGASLCNQAASRLGLR